MGTHYAQHQLPTRTLLLGDENFTFAPCFMDNFPEIPIEVASCLPENRIPEEYRQSMNNLRDRGVPIHFGINPAMLRQHFGLNEAFYRLIFVLPGIAFQGCPQFINRQTDSLFKLRLHLYFFGFIKSSQQTIPEGSLVQILWPNQEAKEGLPRNLPWQAVDIDKLAPFCKVQRCPEEDELLNLQYYKSWRPLIHNIPTLRFPDYLRNCKFYSWRFKKNYVPHPLPPNPGRVVPGEDCPWFDSAQAQADDPNMLRMPSHIFEFSQEELPHVNDLFHFELKTNTAENYVVSKLSVKYDPRISGWKGDGNSGRKPLKAIRPPSNMIAVPPPPPPHENHPPGTVDPQVSAVPLAVSGAYSSVVPTPNMPVQSTHPSYHPDYAVPQSRQQPYSTVHAMPAEVAQNDSAIKGIPQPYSSSAYEGVLGPSAVEVPPYGTTQRPPNYQYDQQPDTYSSQPASHGIHPVHHPHAQPVVMPGDANGGRRRFDWSQMGAYLATESEADYQQPSHQAPNPHTSQVHPHTAAYSYSDDGSMQGFSSNLSVPSRREESSGGQEGRWTSNRSPHRTKNDDFRAAEERHSLRNEGRRSSRTRSRSPRSTYRGVEESRSGERRMRRMSSDRHKHNRGRFESRWLSSSSSPRRYGGGGSCAGEERKKDEGNVSAGHRGDSYNGRRYESRSRRRRGSHERSRSRSAGERSHSYGQPAVNTSRDQCNTSHWNAAQTAVGGRTDGSKHSWQHEESQNMYNQRQDDYISNHFDDQATSQRASQEAFAPSARMVVYSDNSRRSH